MNNINVHHICIPNVYHTIYVCMFEYKYIVYIVFIVYIYTIFYKKILEQTSANSEPQGALSSFNKAKCQRRGISASDQYVHRKMLFFL